MAPSTIVGELRRHPDFPSRFLAPRRAVQVWLPPGYGDRANRRRRYPVLYLHDGQNLFDGATSFIPGKEWRVDETCDRLIRAGRIEPLIVVGIANTGAERLAEYTPTRDPMYGGGKGDLYGRFLVEELNPFIDRTYRTKTGPADTGLGGSSLGGLISMHLGLKYPKVFGKLAVISPSVWWNGRTIVKSVDALPGPLPLKIWLDIGTEESRAALPDARRLRDALLAKGWQNEKSLRYFEEKGAAHNESAWAGRLEAVLTFLFPIR